MIRLLHLSRYSFLLIAFAVMTLANIPSISAQTETVLHSFGVVGDGASPYSGLIFDGAGNLYGTTRYGAGDGTVFNLTNFGGGWTENVLYSFPGGGEVGGQPIAAVILDAAGNLYGTTEYGGAHNSGVAFMLTRNFAGDWSEKVLSTFFGTGGAYPTASLVLDGAGNLYGTTSIGGRPGHGVVFKLAPSNGDWTESVIFTFTGASGTSYANLTCDAAGNLYGTTLAGGAKYQGAVFELTPNPNGGWTAHTLQSFGHSGNFPRAGMIFDAAGNLYGTLSGGGNPSCRGGCGAVFELSPGAKGKWNKRMLYTFTGGSDGSNPNSSVMFDAAGNLYGATPVGGAYGYGTVYELSPTPDGGWTERVLYSFTGGSDGGTPSNVVVDSVGNLYGTTLVGGAQGAGTVFEITP